MPLPTVNSLQRSFEPRVSIPITGGYVLKFISTNEEPEIELYSGPTNFLGRFRSAIDDGQLVEYRPLLRAGIVPLIPKPSREEISDYITRILGHGKVVVFDRRVVG